MVDEQYLHSHSQDSTLFLSDCKAFPLHKKKLELDLGIVSLVIIPSSPNGIIVLLIPRSSKKTDSSFSFRIGSSLVLIEMNYLFSIQYGTLKTNPISMREAVLRFASLELQDLFPS